MRAFVRVAVLIDGGVTPVSQFKTLFEAGCVDRGFSAVEYPIDSSGDISVYYKIEKEE